MEKEIRGQIVKIPRHVAIILDGNGRWAKKRNMPRTYGHKQGAKTLETVCEDAFKLGIEYVTVYAFSTENWKRSEEEVGALMTILRQYLKSWEKQIHEKQFQLRVIGDKTRLDRDIVEDMERVEEASKVYSGRVFTVAINYGGRDEIVRAVRQIGLDLASGTMEACDITEDTISNHLDTKGIPDPDLMIRTSGEQRLSNYLLWQLGYAELYFTDVLWPDFTEEDLIDAIFYYNGRDRRYGGV